MSSAVRISIVATLMNGRAGSMTLSTPAVPKAATSRPLQSGQDTANAARKPPLKMAVPLCVIRRDCA